MIFSLDSAGRFGTINKTGERIVGCPREECLQRRLKEFVLEANLQAFDQWMAKCLAGEAAPPLELQVRGAQDSRFFLELSAQPIREGNRITGLQGIGRDTTGRKQARRPCANRKSGSPVPFA